MTDSTDVKLGVLQELMDKMRELEGQKMRPKAVELSMSSLKPEDETNEPGEGTPLEEALDHKEGKAPDVMQGKSDGIVSEHDEGGPHGQADDELSPEDIAALEELLGEREHEG